MELILVMALKFCGIVTKMSKPKVRKFSGLILNFRKVKVAYVVNTKLFFLWANFII